MAEYLKGARRDSFSPSAGITDLLRNHAIISAKYISYRYKYSHDNLAHLHYQRELLRIGYSIDILRYIAFARAFNMPPLADTLVSMWAFCPSGGQVNIPASTMSSGSTASANSEKTTAKTG
jgi:hypothetical protein